MKKPEYPGGTKALRTFISNHLVYPSEALDQQIEGTVHLRYGIDHHGKVIDVHVIKGVGGGCTEEAIRLVRLLQFNLERTRGIKVLFHKKSRSISGYRLPYQRSSLLQLSNMPIPHPLDKSSQHLRKRKAIR
ncbi:MAG: TonB family protein [Saprospiraceae bacterium]|nr:TonB family protein [Saprospiraceae bacterium]